jgi:shikimate 5-dehydrogenase
MLGLIVFLALFGYFAYNVIYMSRHVVFDFIDGLQMFFFQGALDFYYWVKSKL